MAYEFIYENCIESIYEYIKHEFTYAFIYESATMNSQHMNSYMKLDYEFICYEFIYMNSYFVFEFIYMNSYNMNS